MVMKLLIGMTRSLTIFILALLSHLPCKGQFGIGLAYGVDLYENIAVPNEIDSLQFSGGSALANLVIGPKIWIGKKDVSLSVQAQVGFSPFHFDTKTYRGLGAFYFPISIGMNYGALSGLPSDKLFGLSVGYGLQQNTVDLYLLKEEFEAQRSASFSSQFVQVGVGTGKQGVMVHLYGRYGWTEHNGSHLNIGINLEYNLRERKKYRHEKR